MQLWDRRSTQVVARKVIVWVTLLVLGWALGVRSCSASKGTVGILWDFSAERGE